MFDLHVHAAPDVVPRLADDRTTVAAYAAAGATGCVLKGHCEPTVGRAAAAGAGTGLEVVGGVVCNHPAGGFNPVAVAAALDAGGRVVWLPTVDAAAHRESGLVHPPSCAPSLPAGPALALPPRDPSSEPAVRTILELIAAHDAVLATGHVGGDELAGVVPAARAAGIERILLTHPTFTVPGLDPATTRELVELGAVAEVTSYQLRHQGVTAATLAVAITTIGLEHVVLSSDAGQPDAPPGPQALSDLVDALASEGLDHAALELAAGTHPAELVLS